METPKGAWRIATLLFLYMAINFADKAVVGLAAVPIMKDLDLTPKEYGLLGSSFFLLFSISGIVVGFIANSRPTRWIILILGLSWAVVQFPMVASVGFATLLFCRVLLGAGEGPAGSVAIHAAFKWFPNHKRTMPTAVISQGAALGVIVALPALNYIIVNYSWHWAFGALGLAGLVWVIAWLFLGREGPIADEPLPEAGADRVGYGHILGTPTFIGCTLACFGAYWALSLGLTWFTPFIVKGLGVPQSQAGLIATLPWVMGSCTVLGAGALSQYLVHKGVGTRVCRGVVGTVPLILGGLLLALLPLSDSLVVKIGLLVLGTGLTGPIYVVCSPMLSEFTPVAQRGGVIALFGAIYTLAGVIAPYAQGAMIENAATPLEGYQTGFLVCAAMLVAGGLLGLLLIRPGSDKDRVVRHRIAAASA